MLSHLSTTLRQLIVKALPAEDRPKDITFEQPTREASARWSRPAINLYLYDVRENARLRNMAPPWEARQTNAGGPGERRQPVRLDAHYLLTVWGNSHEDEEYLLNAALMALFRSSSWDIATLKLIFGKEKLTREALKQSIEKENMGEGLLPAALLTHADLEEIFKGEPVPPALLARATSARIVLQVAQNDELQKPTDLWSVLSNDLRPAIPITVTFALQPFDTIAIRPVREAQFYSQDKATEKSRSLFTMQISGRLAIRVNGEPLKREDVKGLRMKLVERDEDVPVDDEWRYRIRGIPPGAYTLEITAGGLPSPQRVTISVPADSYDIEIDVKSAAAIEDGKRARK